MTTPRDQMVETIAAELFNHRLVVVEGRSQCKCGWWVAPLLDSVHRLHQAEHILAATLMATAQINGENLAEAIAELSGGYKEMFEDQERQIEEGQLRTAAMGRLLLDSGDITPMGVRMLGKIWEPVERGV